MDTKRCNKCGQDKPRNAFGTRKLRSGNAGLQSHCKVCRNDQSRAMYAANPGPTIERNTAWNKANAAAHRAFSRKSMTKSRAGWSEDEWTAQREATRQWRLNNPEAAAEWRRNNPEAVAESYRRRVERNPELYRAIGRAGTARRRARIRGALFENVDHRDVWSRDGGICHLCNLPAGEDWHLDHVIPLAAGGSHSYQNTAVSHKACNESKGANIIPSARGFLGAYTIRPTTCP